MKKIISTFLVGLISLSTFSIPTYANEITVTIIHTNDIHGRFVETDNVIGIDRIAAIYNATENSILVDAGDTFHGLPFVNFTQGINAVELMNLAGYRLLTPGNHDFNFGQERLKELSEVAEFDIIAANVLRDGEHVFAPYSLIEVHGITLGIFGIAYPGTPVVTLPANVYGLEFTNPIEVARDTIQALQEHNVNAIIALAHLGISGDAWSLSMAEELSYIDIIIDGHSHTLLEEGLLINDVLIAQAGAHSAYVGILELTFVNGNLTNTVASYINHEYALENFEPVLEISALIEEMESELSYILDEVIGYSPFTLYGDSPEHRSNLRGQEVPLGNLVADSARYNNDSDIAIVNSGNIRYHLHAGYITRGNIIEILAFFNYSVVVEITPYILTQALDLAVSQPGHGRFPQVSGFSFVYNGNAYDGERIISITFNEEELDLNDNETILSLSINNFMHAGGDGFEMFMDLNVIGEGATEDEQLIAFLEIVDWDNVGVEGRIINTAN